MLLGIVVVKHTMKYSYRLQSISSFLFCLFLTTDVLCSPPVETVTIEESTISTRDDSDPYRLPTTVYPESYTVTLKLEDNFGPSGIFEGNVSINLRTYAAVTSVTLHANLLTITEGNIIFVCGESQTNLYASFSTNSTYHFLTIFTNQEIANNTACTLSIVNYTGQLRDDMYGFYRSSYTNASGETEWLATTQFQPTHARRAFPCFDEPKFKATFTITIYHPSDYTAISNTPQNGTSVTDESTGLIIDTFQTTPIMSTYLIAFIVSKYTNLQSEELEYYRVFFREEARDTANYTLHIAPPLLQKLEEFTNIPYISTGIGKLDQVAIPDFSAGAMENWGLVTYRERYLLWDPQHSSNSAKQSIASVIAHELAHSWFGNLVTCDWWSYTWLNEGFARYFQYFTTGEVETTWEMDKQFVGAQQQVIFESDASNSAQALTSDASTPTEVSNKFGSISYNKGASVIRMVEHFLGYDNFTKGLQEYLAAHEFETTVPQYLFDAWAPYATNLPANRTFEQVMTLWTEQPGFPVINVEMQGVDAILTQKRFYLNSSYTSNVTWDIPISYTTSHGPDFDTTSPSLWFSSTESSANISNILHGGTGWVILNVQETGYYRVNYDDTLWSALETALKSDNFDGIHVLNRAQIVDDALNLARAGQLSYSTALNIVSYLEKETEYYPWYSAFTAFTYLYRLIGSHESLGPYFADLVSKLIANVSETVPFDTSNDDDQIYTLKKSLVLSWACRLEIGDCVSKSQEAFANYKNNNVSINPNIRSVVYCYALRHSSDSSDWEFLWQKYLDTKLSTEEVTILGALGCTKNETLLNEYLEKTIANDSTIRVQDFSTLYASVYAYPEGVKVLFEFLKNNYQVLPNYYSSWSGLFSYIAQRFTTEEQIAELEEFYNSNQEALSGVSSTIQSAIASARSNLEWTTTFATQLTAWFTRDSAIDISTNISLVICAFALLLTFWRN